MRTLLAISLAIAIATAVAPVLAQQHEHAPSHAASAPADTTRRYATDETLREQMKGVRAAVEALGHYEQGHMGASTAIEFATAIEDNVHTIIANCKLPADADAALHEIIVPLLQSAGAVKKNPNEFSPIAAMRAALASYDSQFQDP